MKAACNKWKKLVACGLVARFLKCCPYRTAVSIGIETAGIRLIASGVGLLVGAASLLRRIIDYYELSQFLIICGP